MAETDDDAENVVVAEVVDAPVCLGDPRLGQRLSAGLVIFSVAMNRQE